MAGTGTDADGGLMNDDSTLEGTEIRPQYSPQGRPIADVGEGMGDGL